MGKKVTIMQAIYRRYKNETHRMKKALLFLLAWSMVVEEVYLWMKGITMRMAANPEDSCLWNVDLRRDLPQEYLNV